MARTARLLRIAVLSVSLILAACNGPQNPAAPVVEDVRAEVEPVALEAQDTATVVIAPLVIDVREIVQEALPIEVEPPPTPSVDPRAVAHIVRWEISSEAQYRRRYQGVICPGGASGPTRGVGYDDGHQTRKTIAADWPAHPQLDRILPASGQTGETRCRAYRNANRDITTPYGMAYEVFETSTLPKYRAVTERAFRNGWDELPPIGQGVLVATVYNRGASMRGERRREMRVLRDECVPRADLDCMAEQFESMCRIWRGTPNESGLCARYRDAAKLVKG